MLIEIPDVSFVNNVKDQHGKLFIFLYVFQLCNLCTGWPMTIYTLIPKKYCLITRNRILRRFSTQQKNGSNNRNTDNQSTNIFSDFEQRQNERIQTFGIYHLQV